MLSNTGGAAGAAGGRLTLRAAEAAPVPVGALAGVAWALPETDPACGPGVYRLTRLTLGLGLAAPPANGSSIALAIALYSAAPESGAPAALLASASVEVDFSEAVTSPAYYSIPLPARFVANASAAAVTVAGANASFAVVFGPIYEDLYWWARLEPGAAPALSTLLPPPFAGSPRKT